MKTTENKVILRGRLGKDPEVRPFETDRSVANTSIATPETYKKDGEYVTDTQWHNLVFWGEQASFAELNLKKGMLVHIEGKLTHRSYIDKNNITRYVSEVVVKTAYEVKEAEPEEPAQAD